MDRFNGSVMKYPYPLKIVNGGSWIIERSIFVRSVLVSAHGVKNEILDPFHVIVAAHKSLHLFRQGKMKTRTLHSEIIFNLSPSNNISDSFKKFGIMDDTKEILVAMVAHGNATEKVSELSKLIKGTLVSMDTLASICDKEKIKKVYGIRENELECDSLENAIISRLATKDAS